MSRCSNIEHNSISSDVFLKISRSYSYLHAVGIQQRSGTTEVSCKVDCKVSW